MIPDIVCIWVSFFLAQRPTKADFSSHPRCHSTWRNAGNRGISETANIEVETVDSDGDGLPDLWEQNNGFNPAVANNAAQDSDGDGLTDLEEFLAKTNPRSADTSGDGISDKFAIALGLDPLASNPQMREAILANSGELGLASESQIRTLHPGTPLLTRNAATGNFTLRFGLHQTNNLNQWEKLPLTVTGSSISDGWLDFSFSSSSNAMFYRVSVDEN